MRIMQSAGQIKAYLIKAWKSFGWTDLRWAHLWIVSLCSWRCAPPALSVS